MIKVGIIGSGASGMMCASYLNDNFEVTIFEKNNKSGKKLLLTGNGRCNYWNKDINIDKYYSNNKDILEKIISKENQDNTFDFLSSLGIYPKIIDDYYYPYSLEGSSVNEVFNEKIKHLNIKYNTSVLEIKKDNNKFVVFTNNGNYYFDKLIIATGSKAYPKTGSNGDGYRFAKDFNHKVIDVKPSLTALKCINNINGIDGVRSEVKLSLYHQNTLLKEEIGQIQFNKRYISGICVFNISNIPIRNNFKDYSIKINFLPNIDNIDIFLKTRKGSLYQILNTVINSKIINYFLKYLKKDKDSLYDNLTLKEKDVLKKLLTNFTININGSKDFDNAQVASGGIPLNEINPNSMESLKEKDLYFIGEVLDTDGICGGFNLAFAFITGYIAANNINRL